MAYAAQIKIPATYMRGGTSKGVFFSLLDLPAVAQVPGAARIVGCSRAYCRLIIPTTDSCVRPTRASTTVPMAAATAGVTATSPACVGQRPEVKLMRPSAAMLTAGNSR